MDVDREFDADEFFQALSSGNNTSTDDTEQDPWNEVRRKRSKKRKASGSPSWINQDDTIVPPPPFPSPSHTQTNGNKYVLIITSVNPEIKLGLQNPLKMQRALSESVGTAKHIRSTKNGNLVVECHDKQQWRSLLKKVQIGEWQIRVNVPKSATSSIGVIYNVPLDQDILDADFCTVLKEQKVVKAIRLTYYDQIEKTRKPSKSVKLFFSVPSVPKTVDIGFKSYKTKLFVPKPIQCFKCQGYGHMSNECRNTQRCIKCGENHQNENCKTETHLCINCKGKHMANDKACPVRETMKKTLKIAKEEKITLKQAEYKLKAVKKSDIKTKTHSTKTKESQSTGRSNIEYCTVEQLIVAISVSISKLLKTESSINDLKIESIMGFIAMTFKQMYGHQFDMQKGIDITNRVTTDMI